MKKFLMMLMICLLALPALAAAAEFEGSVTAPGTMLVTAPYGGVVQSVAVRQGQRIEAGDEIARMQMVRVYAPEDGIVRGLFAQPGDAVSDSAVLYLQPVNLYTINCTTSQSYDSQDAKYVRIGETVYIIAVTDGSYLGEGEIVTVDQSAFTVQTTDGAFDLEKNVYLYRDQAGSSAERIGRGTVYRMDETPVYGSGSLLKLYVENGEAVTRGQLLFETVAGEMLYDAAEDGVIRAQEAGVIAALNLSLGGSIAKDAVVLELIQPDTYEIEFLIGEDLLGSVYVGQQANIVFNWSEDTGEIVRGRVSHISYASEASETASDSTIAEVQYKGYITFTPSDTVKQGMSVIVETID